MNPRNVCIQRLSICRAWVAVLAFSSAFTVAASGGECRVVRGHLVNTPVTENCDSPIFCAEGRLLGGLNGKFQQKGIALTPAGAALGDPGVPPSVILGSADIFLETHFCGGVMKLKDTFVLNSAPPDSASPSDAFFSAVHTVIPEMSAGGCFGVTGQLRVQGVSTPTGVRADYEGVICTQ